MLGWGGLPSLENVHNVLIAGLLTQNTTMYVIHTYSGQSQFLIYLDLSGQLELSLAIYVNDKIQGLQT